MSLSGIQNLNAWVAVDAYLVSKVFKVLDFMPDLKVGQFMPVVIDLTTLLFHRQRLKSLFGIEANLHTYSSSLTISLKSPMALSLLFLLTSLNTISSNVISSHFLFDC